MRPWTPTFWCTGLAEQRLIPFTEFHRLPGNAPEHDNVLERGNLILAIEVPARSEGRASHYFKLRDRQSYEFALVSAAVAVAADRRRISLARIAMGGVAHKPWRLTATESALRGAPSTQKISYVDRTIWPLRFVQPRCYRSGGGRQVALCNPPQFSPS